MRPDDPQRNAEEDDQRLPDEDVGIVEVLGQEDTDVEEGHDAHQIEDLDREQTAGDSDDLGRPSGREGEHPGDQDQAGNQTVTAEAGSLLKATSSI